MPLSSKQLLEESRARRTWRKFLPDAVDMDVIRDCILTAGTAPNGANLQPWHYTIVTDPEMKQRIRTAAEAVEREFYAKKISDKWREDLDVLKVNAEKPFLTEAPCLIAVFEENFRFMEDGSRAPNYYVPTSVGISLGLLINALRNAGYATLTYTPAPAIFLRELLGRPQNETPVMILVVGKPDSSYELPPITKKAFEEIADII